MEKPSEHERSHRPVQCEESNVEQTLRGVRRPWKANETDRWLMRGCHVDARETRSFSVSLSIDRVSDRFGFRVRVELGERCSGQGDSCR